MTAEELKSSLPIDPSSDIRYGYHLAEVSDLFNERYQVIRKLGWGCFSSVWLCWDLQDMRYVAVKVSRCDKNSTQTTKREIKLLNCAGNSNIDDTRRNSVVQLLDNFKLTGVNGDHICLVFEVMGKNLCDLNRMPLSEVKKIIKQVLEGLDYLHTKCNIIHTDIKPENILACVDANYILQLAEEVGFEPSLTENQKNKLKKEEILSEKELQELNTSEITVKIGDLGSACWIDNHFNESIQSPGYRAPEVILGANYGPSVDIWSLACTAFELATGELLFIPNETNYYSREDDHLANMVYLLGKIPKRMALSGKHSEFYFTEDGELRRIKVEPYGFFEFLVETCGFYKDEARGFVDFLLPMFEFDPEKRASAQDCINHPWINQ